jgi:FtsP/CotA-like multicopper oxidase with cupredoxin domain
MVIPPAMPTSGNISQRDAKFVDYFEIAQRQFQQQILPPGFPMTTVWSYGAIDAPETFHYPAFTIEATWAKPTRVKWINDLVDAEGNFLPHLLPVDQTLHWANPTGECRHGESRPDCSGLSQAPYTGPVPMVVHVHGAETTEWSDGYPEAWWLPAANDIPPEIQFTTGGFFGTFQAGSPLGNLWEPGSVVFEYPNEQRATTLWYHDHSLGMTRVNVLDGVLPGPAPARKDPASRRYFDIPIAIQDRSFNDDGSLFYPDNRAFFEGLEPGQLQIPFTPDQAFGGDSDVAPIWNPEFFGNTMVVNGRTWPYLEVEQRRYRLRLLNGCQSRFLILKMDHEDLSFWQIGAEGGFLPEAVELEELLVAPAERADVIVDFSDLPVGTEIVLLNLGPDDPFGGGEPGVDFDPADPGTTGQVMQFRVVKRKGKDRTTEPSELRLPQREELGYAINVRQLSLNEEESATVRVRVDQDGNVVLHRGGEPFGPTAALLGTLNEDGTGHGLLWNDEITENPLQGDTEMWEFYNFTADAHPIHIHLVQFEVVNREDAFTGEVYEPEEWETGTKDTVIAYPDQITRVKARFDLEGLFVWHCHILEHEDNEMMRPYCVGNSTACDQHGIAP